MRNSRTFQGVNGCLQTIPFGNEQSNNLFD